MSVAPSLVLTSILRDQGVGVTDEADVTTQLWAIKLGKRTETPDNLIVLTDTGGSNPNTKFLLDFVHVQALVRARTNDYLAAFSKAMEIKNALLGLDAQTVVVDLESVRLSGITMMGDIAFLRYDESWRPLFSVNFRIMLERDTTDPLSNRDSL